ncbi:MAG: DUF559 domain-containing protein [Desertifilum sp.]|nr:DUF559 domain-containing protein [Desertifilum sp.]
MDRLHPPSPLGRRAGDEGQIYVVSNPPFIGNARMRDRLGDGYTETLRQVYSDVPETVDYVMYWWHKAAELARANYINRFGFITTNSIHQVRQRKAIESHQNQKNPIRLIFAIADHPWTNEGAAVRIAMTVGQADSANIVQIAQLGTVIQELDAETPEDLADKVEIFVKNVEQIFSNLQAGSDITKLRPLKSNARLTCRGVMINGSGFLMEEKEFYMCEQDILFPYLNGRDFMQDSRNLKVIDLSALNIQEVQKKFPKAYQWILERVKPQRDASRDQKLRDRWWIFERPRPELRAAVKDLQRYIATVETAKHRVFVFLPHDVIPDNMLIAIALDDAYFLGVLSSSIHAKWCLANGGSLGVYIGNIRYNKTRCFDPFPFPEPSATLKQRIRELGERLDAHRKRVQAQHPDVTITAMYNLLEKIRAGEELTEKDWEFNNKALVSTLKQIHDELDVAVFEAYGWEDLIFPSPLTPLPEGEGNRNLDLDRLQPPSPLGRRAGDEGRRAGDEGISKLAGRTRQIPSELLQRARKLRQQQTPAEQLLWECLRDRRLYNAKFRRQHNLGQFIADFYCHTARIVIELDGKIHQQPQQQHRDRDRDQWMQANGFTVLRFRNEEVFSNTEAVLEVIVQSLPSSLTPRPLGEGNRIWIWIASNPNSLLP